MIIPTLAGYGIAQFQYTLLQHGIPTFDARLAGDLGVSIGDVIPLAWGDTLNTITQMEVIQYGDAGTQRWHAVLTPVGATALRQPCVPTFISKPTPDTVVQALYQGVYNFVTPVFFQQDNLTLPSSITNFQALSRYFNTDIRFDFTGTLQIGTPIPTPNTGSFGLLNPNISAKIIDVCLTGEDIVLNAGDIIFGGAIVSTVEIIGGMDQVRLRVQLTDDSPNPIILPFTQPSQGAPSI